MIACGNDCFKHGFHKLKSNLRQNNGVVSVKILFTIQDATPLPLRYDTIVHPLET